MLLIYIIFIWHDYSTDKIKISIVENDASIKNNAITLTKVTSRFKNSAKPAHTPATFFSAVILYNLFKVSPHIYNYKLYYKTPLKV